MEYQMTCILNKGQESCDTSVVLIQLSFMNNRVTKCFSSKFPSNSLLKLTCSWQALSYKVNSKIKSMMHPCK